MIIHNPIVSGSLTFAEGAVFTAPITTDYSGSFSGSFVGDGSNLTGIAATSFNIDALDALGGATVAQDDNILISDAGTEKKATFSNLEDSIFANISGDITIAAGGSATLDNAYINTSLNSYTASNDTTNSTQNSRLDQLSTETGSISTEQAAQDSRLDQLSTETGSISTEQAAQDSRLSNLEANSGSYLTTVDISSDTNLAVSDTTNVDMILSGDTLSANLKGGVVSGSSQITLSSTTGYDANEHIDHTSVSITAGTGLNGGGTIAATRTLNVDSDYKNDSLNTFTASLDTDLATFSVPASTTISSFGKTLVDDADASAARTTLGVDAAGTDNSTDVTLSGTPDYITISGQVITRNTIDIGDDTNLTAGTGITLTGDTLSTTDSEIVHDNLSGFVANEHIDHSTVSITAGTGLNGGGTIAATRTLNVDSDYKNDSLNTFTASLSTNLADLTDSEVAQLENIGTTTISSTQWGYLGASNQGITTTSNVQFGDLTLSGNLTVNGDTSYISSSVVQIGDNILELNGSAGANGGIYVRDAVGTTNSGSLLWDTTNDYWKAGAKGSENEILTTGNVDADIKTFSLPASTTISSFGKTLVDDANASAARTTLGVDAAGTDNSTDVTLANTNYLSISGQVLTGGTVPVGSGGTGATTAAGARSALGVDAAGTDNSTDVTLAGTPNYITISGQVITRNTIDIGDDTNLTASTGITLTGDTLTTNDGEIVHDNLSGFVANEHIDHSSVSVTAGAGLTGGGTIAATRTINVGAGTGVTVNANDIAIGQAVGTGDDVTFGTVRVDDATASTTKTTGALIVDGGAGIGLDLNVGGDVVAYASSDERYKDNVTPIQNPNDKIKQIGGYTFDWNDKHELFKGKHDVGVIAQEIEQVLPEIVETRDNGFKAVKYEKIVALLIESNKELIKRIEELESKIS